MGHGTGLQTRHYLALVVASSDYENEINPARERCEFTCVKFRKFCWKSQIISTKTFQLFVGFGVSWFWSEILPIFENFLVSVWTPTWIEYWALFPDHSDMFRFSTGPIAREKQAVHWPLNSYMENVKNWKFSYPKEKLYDYKRSSFGCCITRWVQWYGWFLNQLNRKSWCTQKTVLPFLQWGQPHCMDPKTRGFYLHIRIGRK